MDMLVILRDRVRFDLEGLDVLRLHLADHFANVVLCCFEHCDERAVAGRAVGTQ